MMLNVPLKKQFKKTNGEVQEVWNDAGLPYNLKKADDGSLLETTRTKPLVGSYKKKNKQVIGQLPRGGKNLSLVGNITLTFYCKYKKQKTMEGSISTWFY